MKKLLLIAVTGSAIFGSHIVSAAYTHTVINATEYPAVVHMEYAACKNDNVTIPSAGRLDNPAGLCILQKISATVNTDTIPGWVQNALTSISSYGVNVNLGQLMGAFKGGPVDTIVNYEGPYTGSNEWIIYGTRTNGFGITRFVH